MFRGPSKIALDSKGRLAVPVRYRERIVARAEGNLVATADLDHCLLLYPLPDWEEVERKLVRLSSLDPRAQELKRLMLGHAVDLEMDSHGRVLLSKELREFANLDRQVMLIGQGNKFELWDEDHWTKRRDEWLANKESNYSSLSQELENFSF
jgi:MraZ protein